MAYRDKERNADADATTQADLLKQLEALRTNPAMPDAAREALFNDHVNSARMVAGGRNIDPYIIQAREKFRLARREGGVEAISRLLDAGDEQGARALAKNLSSGTALSGAASYVAGKESGREGGLAIGYDKNGGTSYGKYQIASKSGTMGDFIGWLDKKGAAEAATALKEAGGADTGSRTGKMPEVWKALVQSGKITDAMQDEFIQETHVRPVLEKLSPELRGLVEDNPAFARAVFSTAVQHGPGGAQKLISAAWNASGGDGQKFFTALYDARSKEFGSSTAEVRAGVMNRLKTELTDALSGGGLGGRPVFDAATKSKVEGMIATAVADNKAQAYMARIEAGEDEYAVQKEILALPPKERGPVNSQFRAYKAVYNQQQAELTQVGIVDLREKLVDMPLGEAYRTVHALPENTKAERNIRRQALADYAYLSSHQGLSRSTDPDAYNELVDKIAYADIGGGEAGIRQLKADPLAIKVAKKDLDKLVDDLKGASVIPVKELKTHFLWAIGADDGPNAKPLNVKQKKRFLEFVDWAERKTRETNRAKEPGYARELARQFVMDGETERKPNEWAAGYGKDKTYGEALDDPNWLPILTGDRKAEIDRLFSANPEWVKKEMEKGGFDDLEIAERVYYKKLLEQDSGKRQRPQQGVTQ